MAKSVNAKYEKRNKKMRSDYNMLPPIIYPINNNYSTVNMCNDAQKYFNKVKLGESKKNVYDRVIPFFFELICSLKLISHSHKLLLSM